MDRLTPADLRARVAEFVGTPAARHRRRLRLGADLAALRDDTLARLQVGVERFDDADLRAYFADLFDAYVAIVHALQSWQPDRLGAAAAIFGAEVDDTPLVPVKTLIDQIDVVWREV